MDDRSGARQGLRLVAPAIADAKDANASSPKMGTVSQVLQTTDASIRPGVVVNGKYLISKVIGEGGVGIVYEAQNLELDEKVALKCLRNEVLVDTAMVARFAREAKAAASIKSEYVATVHDVGTMADGSPYMVMEYLEGRDLGAVVQERGVLGPRASTEYALHVCEALAVAHAKGIVHRDIKPENLMLTERTGGMRIVKVLDFGISKAALTGSIFRNDLPLVKTVSLMGTPLYMSPEQVRNTDSVDVRSDIWSLGMVLYELLTGTTAFSASSITELCAAILEAAPQPIEMHRKDLPSGLVDVIHRCLEKDPAKRFQNVAELAIALMPFGPKRARLNVERSIAVLQGSGMLDVRVRVQSTMPPPMAGDMPFDSFPAAPRVPSVPGLSSTGETSAHGSTSGLPAEAPSASVSGPVSDPSLPLAPAPARITDSNVAPTSELDVELERLAAQRASSKNRTVVIVGALAAVAAIAIAFVATRGSRATVAEPARPSTPTMTAAQATAPATATTTATTGASAAEAATTAAAAAAPARPTEKAAGPGAGASAAARPAWATAPMPPAGKGTAARPGAKPAPSGAPGATSTPSAAPTPARTADEPDLGY